MRKIVANLFVSLDGVVEAPEKWTFPYFNEEVGQAVGEGFASSDALLMGRVNYQEWASVWPTREGPLADTVNGIRKYVVTSTLDTVEWTNSSIVTGDVAAEITALKEQPGRDIAMSGSASLVEWLLHAGLCSTSCGCWCIRSSSERAGDCSTPRAGSKPSSSSRPRRTRPASWTSPTGP